MSIATDTVPLFRTQWSNRMVDTCTIVRRSPGALNTTTGVYTPTEATQYTGACLVRPQSPTSVSAGQELVEKRDYLIMVPYTVTAVAVDDIVKVDSTRDGVLDIKELVVRNVRTDSLNTVRKLDCEDNQGG